MIVRAFSLRSSWFTWKLPPTGSDGVRLRRARPDLIFSRYRTLCKNTHEERRGVAQFTIGMPWMSCQIGSALETGSVPLLGHDSASLVTYRTTAAPAPPGVSGQTWAEKGQLHGPVCGTGGVSGPRASCLDGVSGSRAPRCPRLGAGARRGRVGSAR